MESMKFSAIIFILAMLLPLGGPLQASGKASAPLDPAYLQECGSCHVAYPARMLPASSWQALLNGLDRHFGSDASLTEETRREIGRYLQENASQREISSAGKPILRITETSWFRHEHGEIPAPMWKTAAVKSPANCPACHLAAEKGRYGEHQIRLPK